MSTHTKPLLEKLFGLDLSTDGAVSQIAQDMAKGRVLGTWGPMGQNLPLPNLSLHKSTDGIRRILECHYGQCCQSDAPDVGMASKGCG